MKILLFLMLIIFPVEAQEMFCRPVLNDSCWTTNADYDKQVWLDSLPKTINFDDSFNFKYCSFEEDCQVMIDKDYLVQIYEDYYHHNTKGFMSVFNSIKSGDKVIINGNEYTADFKEPAKVVDYIYMMGNNTNQNYYMNSSIELITCADPFTSPNRILWHLTKQKPTS